MGTYGGRARARATTVGAAIGLVLIAGVAAGNAATLRAKTPPPTTGPSGATGPLGATGPSGPVRRPIPTGPQTTGNCPRRIVAVTSKVSHAGWPVIDGCLTINTASINATIDFRGSTLHNELLGGHGNDTIYAGNAGDVIWGDYFPTGQPSTQVDNLHGGPGNDFIYSSHGTNNIWTGAGADQVHLVYGHGTVVCGPGHKTLTMRKLPQNRHWKLIGCTDITIIPYAA